MIKNIKASFEKNQAVFPKIWTQKLSKEKPGFPGLN